MNYPMNATAAAAAKPSNGKRLEPALGVPLPPPLPDSSILLVAFSWAAFASAISFSWRFIAALYAAAAALAC